MSPRTWDNPKKKLADWLEGQRRSLVNGRTFFTSTALWSEDWLCTVLPRSQPGTKHELNCFPAAGVRSTDEFWDEYSTRFWTATGSRALGRASAADRDLVRKLSGASANCLYAADSPDGWLPSRLLRFAAPRLMSASSLGKDSCRRHRGRSPSSCCVVRLSFLLGLRHVSWPASLAQRVRQWSAREQTTKAWP